jgi:hypothetical protein
VWWELLKLSLPNVVWSPSKLPPSTTFVQRLDHRKGFLEVIIKIKTLHPDERASSTIGNVVVQVLHLCPMDLATHNSAPEIMEINVICVWADPPCLTTLATTGVSPWLPRGDSEIGWSWLPVPVLYFTQVKEGPCLSPIIVQPITELAIWFLDWWYCCWLNFRTIRLLHCDELKFNSWSPEWPYLEFILLDRDDWCMQLPAHYDPIIVRLRLDSEPD